jgi:hypothetical protein
VPYTPPIPSSFTSLQIPAVQPLQANPVLLTPLNATWGYGSWVQLVAANILANNALAYLFLLTDGPSGAGNFEYEVQLGTGAAGSEVAFGKWHGAGFANLNPPGDNPLTHHVFPLHVIPANARVAGRVAANLATGQIYITLGLYPLPL